jgi:hypothetical protein
MRKSRKTLIREFHRNEAIQKGLKEFGLLFIRAGPIYIDGSRYSLNLAEIMPEDSQEKLIIQIINQIQVQNNSILKQLKIIP